MKDLTAAALWAVVKCFEDGTSEEDKLKEVNFETILQILANRDQYLDSELGDHIGDTSNPHEVSRAQIGAAATNGSSSSLFAVAAATAAAYAVRLDQFTATLGNPSCIRIPVWTGSVRHTLLIQFGTVTGSSSTNVTLPATVSTQLTAGAFYGGTNQSDPDTSPTAYFLDNSTIRVQPEYRGGYALWMAFGYV